MKEKRIGIIVVVMILMLLASGCTTKSDLETADDFTAMTLDGRTVSLSDYRGEVVVLNFWGIWCPYCVNEMADFYEVTQQYPEVIFLMINTSNTLGHEDPEQIQLFLEDKGLSFENVVLNETIAQSYGVRSFPSTYVIDADGNIVESVKGAIDQSYLVLMIDTAYEK